MDIGSRFKIARTKAEVSLSELSDLTGIAKSTLQRYETGNTKKIPMDAIPLIEKALNLPVGYLLGWEEKIQSLPEPSVTEEYVTFPVIGEIAAGYEHIAVEDWLGEKIEIPRSYLAGRKKEDFFVLKIVGDSMYPLYHEGDKVLILKQSTLNASGDIGAIIYEDEKATLKKVEYVPGEDWMRLVPINPNIPPTTIKGEALEHCRVIGIPKLLIREIN